MYRESVGIPMGINCAPLGLFLFCYARDVMLFLFDKNQADAIEAFNSILLRLRDCLKCE